MKKILTGIAILTAMVFFAAVVCSFGKTERQKEEFLEKRYTATFLDVFDTRTEIVGYGFSEEEFMKKAEIIKEKLLYYHRLFDIYQEYEGISNMKTINEQAGKRPVKVDWEVIELLQFCIEMYERSEKQVNVAMGSILSIWHDYREEGRNDPQKAVLPPIELLKEAAAFTDIQKVRIDEKESAVFLENTNMSLDVGGIGKGYAVEKAAEYAKSLGFSNLLISVGGNVRAIGGKIDGSSWNIGIQNPDLDEKEKYVQKVKIKDVSVVTSGNYQRFYTVDGKEYCHIIDPDTLMPAEYAASVTIIAEDSGLADAMSTALYNMPIEVGLDFINKTKDLEAMWVMEDGSIIYSDHFENYIA